MSSGCRPDGTATIQDNNHDGLRIKRRWLDGLIIIRGNNNAGVGRRGMKYIALERAWKRPESTAAVLALCYPL